MNLMKLIIRVLNLSKYVTISHVIIASIPFVYLMTKILNIILAMNDVMKTVMVKLTFLTMTWSYVRITRIKCNETTF